MVYELLSTMDGTTFRDFFILILLRGFAIIFLDTYLIILLFKMRRNVEKCNTTFENIGCKYRISYA
jgi:hypothetical protein